RRCRSARWSAPISRADARRSSSPTTAKTPTFPTRRSSSRFPEASMSFTRTSFVFVLGVAVAALSGCAAAASQHRAVLAEQSQDYDLAVVEYTKLARANPADRNTLAGLQRVKLKAAQDHMTRARRLSGLDRYDEAAVEYQLAAELNPTDPQIDAALKDTRDK